MMASADELRGARMLGCAWVIAGASRGAIRCKRPIDGGSNGRRAPPDGAAAAGLLRPPRPFGNLLEELDDFCPTGSLAQSSSCIVLVLFYSRWSEKIGPEMR
jgi:hypothetical protein